MNPVCDNCTSQTTDGRGGVKCGRARYYEPNPGYSSFKGGSLCRYDTDLKDYFKPKTGEEVTVRSLSAQVSRQRDNLMQLEYEKGELEKRLISVERGAI